LIAIPVAYITYLASNPPSNTSHLLTHPIHQHYRSGTTLRDGRRLAYAEYGPKDGFPVLHFHPLPGSRLLSHVDIEEITKNTGVRLIIVDRPGIGLSSPAVNRELLDWADDISQLIKHLNIEKFSVSGHSAGGPHALAVAYKLPEKVHRVAIIGGVIFPTCFGESEDSLEWKDVLNLRPLNKMTGYLGMYYPKVLYALTKVIAGSGMLVNVNASIDAIAEIPGEAEIFKDQRWRDLFYHVSADCVQQGPYMLDELILIPKNWKFHINQIEVPVDVWHGSNDELTSLTMAKYTAKQVPGAQLHIIDGEGHYSLWAFHLTEILRRLVEEY